MSADSGLLDRIVSDLVRDAIRTLQSGPRNMQAAARFDF
jgi:hypothetical protein